MTDSDVLQKASADLRELLSQEEQVRRTIDGLTRRHLQLQDEIENLKTTISVMRRYMNEERSEERPKEQLLLTPPDVEEMTTADLARTIIEVKGGRARTQEIIAEMEKLGKLRAGNKNNYNLLLQALARHPDEFVRPEPGVWEIVAPVRERVAQRLAGLAEGGQHKT
jgi:hypothetical protein